MPPSFTTFASEINGKMCIDDPNGSTTDGTQLVTYDCNAGANQQFEITGHDVQFKSIGSSAAVKVHGKCLDIANGHATYETHVELQTCNGSAAQRVTVGPNGELEMSGLCVETLAIRGKPLVMAPCGQVAGTELWQLR